MERFVKATNSSRQPFAKQLGRLLKKGSAYSAYYNNIAKRRGKKRALVALANRMLMDIYRTLKTGEPMWTRERRPWQRRLADLVHDENNEKERESVRKVVQRLADARLVTTSLDKGEETVQIIHDSLIREWARLQRWLKKDRSLLAWERELEKDAREWRDTSPSDVSERDEGRLLRGRRLEEAERWQKERERDLGEAEREFVEASLGLRESESPS